MAQSQRGWLGQSLLAVRRWILGSSDPAYQDQLAGSSAYWKEAMNAVPPGPRSTQSMPVGPESPSPAEERDEVAEASDESFPASDPPSWSPTTAGPPQRN